MSRRPPGVTRTDTLFPSTTLVRSVPEPRRDRDGFGGDEPDRSADGRRHAHRAALVDVHHSRRLSAHAETRGKSHSTRRRSDMKKSVTFALGLALTAGLAACGQQGETLKTAADAAAPAKDVGAIAMLAETRHSTGTGTVTAIDTTPGTAKTGRAQRRDRAEPT